MEESGKRDRKRKRPSPVCESFIFFVFSPGTRYLVKRNKTDARKSHKGTPKSSLNSLWRNRVGIIEYIHNKSSSKEVVLQNEEA